MLDMHMQVFIGVCQRYRASHPARQSNNRLKKHFPLGAFSIPLPHCHIRPVLYKLCINYTHTHTHSNWSSSHPDIAVFDSNNLTNYERIVNLLASIGRPLLASMLQGSPPTNKRLRCNWNSQTWPMRIHTLTYAHNYKTAFIFCPR